MMFSGLRGWLAGSRIVGEFSFLFEGALIWALAGAALALATPAPPFLASVSGPARLFFKTGIGFGAGWWGGLPWSLALTLAARGHQPAPPVTTLTRITWIAVCGFVVVAVAANRLGLAMIASIGLAVLVATLAARAALAWEARRQFG